MRSFRFTLAAITAALASPPLIAADASPEQETETWYDVELIVFRNLETRSTETWPADMGAPDVENAEPLFPPVDPQSGEAVLREDDAATDTPAATVVPYEPLDESSYRLAGVMDSLQRSSIYEPVLHAGWTQPPLERSESPYVRITLPGALEPETPVAPEGDALSGEMPRLEGGAELRGEPEETYAQSEETVEPSFSTEDIPEDALEMLADEPETRYARPLDGVLQLSVSRYLHLDLDLLYLPDDLNLAVLDDDVLVATREQTQEERQAREQRRRELVEALARGDITLEEAEILSLEPEQPVFEGFRLNQYRRLRSREIHYFDHPVFGAIVTVTPREVPVETSETGLE